MSRTQHMAKGAAGVAVLALVAAACGSAPTKPAAKSTSTTAASSTTATTASPSGSAPSGSAPSGSTPSGSTPSGSSSTTAAAGNTASFKGCMVTDTGGIDDRSFNASAWKGLQQAHAADPSIHVQYLQSTAQSDYVPNINAFINQHCNLIVTVGFLMADATKAAAKAHPSQHFAIVDNAYSPPIKNVRALLYNTANDAFLGGYLAAGLTKTGKVATYGGENFSTVTIYMDGFWDGVQYYNKKHHKSVQ
ncbi:MAG: BMP family ABC transporter substrate-binding protein, partial [Acidimicrobiales bacterium]